MYVLPPFVGACPSPDYSGLPFNLFLDRHRLVLTIDAFFEYMDGIDHSLAVSVARAIRQLLELTFATFPFLP